jgi:hypothetical protein
MTSGSRDDGGARRDGQATCQATILETQPLGMRIPRGEDIYALRLTVRAHGRPAFEAQIASAVPSAALALLQSGTSVPARQMPAGDERELVIDWGAALAQQQEAAAARRSPTPGHAAEPDVTTPVHTHTYRG